MLNPDRSTKRAPKAAIRWSSARVNAQRGLRIGPLSAPCGDTDVRTGRAARTTQVKRGLPSLGLVALMLLTLGSAWADQNCGGRQAALEVALVRLAASELDALLGAVADSVRALGNTYAALAAGDDAKPPADPERWLDTRTTRERATGVRTWPADLAAPPAFQAPYPGFYSFRGEAISDRVLRQFDLFERLVPTFRTAYESFPFSWVYITTADDAMMIYPYVPLDEAVDDGTPTENLYYKAADFAGRQVGWTPPYLDLVGAGMMVTASYPVYSGDSLLGVMSRDITLKQLSESMLSKLAVAGGRALIVADDGRAIAASEPALADEIDRVNTEASAAALYYRTTQGIEMLGAKDAVASESAETNALVEQVLVDANRFAGGVVRSEIGGKRVLAAPLERTGWLVILVQPED